MKQVSNYKIGILFDHPEYVKQLGKYSGLNLVSLPLSLIFSKRSKATYSFVYEDNVIDYLIIYTAIKHKQRQNHYGLGWIKSFRLSGFNTPILLLSWMNNADIENIYGVENPFLKMDKSESIIILQLPVLVAEIYESLQKLSPLSQKQFDHCTKNIKLFEKEKIKHDLINIGRISNLHSAKRELTILTENNVAFDDYAIIIKELLSCSSLEKFIELIETFNVH